MYAFGATNTVNRKALAVFLAITFGVTVTLVIAARLMGFAFFGQPIYLSQIAILAAMFVPAAAALTFIATTLFNLIPLLGEEIGWRGFLLPALEPPGRAKAAIISGMIWALWHTPMILTLGFLYGRDSWLGALLRFTIVTCLGIWMAEIFGIIL